MARLLRILVADDEARMQDYYRTILAAAGHEVVGVASTGSDLVEQCGKLTPDLVISDVKMPDMDGIEAAGRNLSHGGDSGDSRFGPSRSGPDRSGAGRSRHGLSGQADQAGRISSRPSPSPCGGSPNSRPCARRRPILRQALADRKIIEQAKRMLMETAGMDEPAAFRRLQKLASEKNRKLIDIAQMVLTANEAMRPRG